MGARGIVARSVGFVLGSLVGFFGSFNVVFTDGGSSQRVSAILLVALAVGVIAALVSAIDRGADWAVALWVWLPGAAMLAAYIALGEHSAWWWAAFVAAITLGTAVIGALLGGRAGGRMRVS